MAFAGDGFHGSTLLVRVQAVGQCGSRKPHHLVSADRHTSTRQ
jgi:hypothetical protein